MRPSVIAGIVLVALGGLVLLRGMNYKTTNEVMKVGDVSVTATESQRIPTWVGVTAVVVGIGLVGAGVMRRLTR